MYLPLIEGLMKENVREFYIFQCRNKNSKTGKWVDDKWFNIIDDAKDYKSNWLEFKYKHYSKEEIPEIRIIRRVTYDEEISLS